ncbi:MAG: helix-turn-helix transcriptional regulator [Rhodobacteraceae bacterium]|nr:helix-turn-helix transcriptional regulator [Paracoccaceae bacterium]
MDENTVSNRIRKLIGESSERDFAQRIGITQSSLSAVLSGSRPSIDKVVTIADATGINLNWLATGRGPIYEGDLPDAKYFLIPLHQALLFDKSKSDSRVTVTEHIPFLRSYIKCCLNRDTIKNLMMIYARGDSMEPTIGSGDLLMVDTNMTDIASGVFVNSIDGVVSISRLNPEGGAVRVLYDNSQIYGSRLVKLENIDSLNILGAVVWAGKVKIR